MLPKSKLSEQKHREHKRQIEIITVIEEISGILKNRADSCFRTKDAKILEFGSGDGFQIPYLKQLGSVIALDINRSIDIEKLKGVEFVECNIARTPFGAGVFDIIYSNHVIEHLENTVLAFKELFRIGKPTCIYAFSVPTSIWLLLSLPAQYLGKLKSLLNLLSSKLLGLNKKNKVCQNSAGVSKGKLGQLLGPSSHGVSASFIECYHNFKIKNWYKLFSNNGFSVIEIKPLLLYGPSEWPILSTQKPKFNLCSSVLFLMSKREF